MVSYNLIRNSTFGAATSSGTGNKDLSQTELYSLVDDTTTYSGVALGISDVLYLDVDMHQRIQINGIFLYADDLTKLDNIDFYYKNHEEDDFYGCSKDVSTTYTAIIPPPSAPRYIRCVISGVNMNLYEFSVFNDGTKVKFGEDGLLNSTWLSNSPVGEYGDPQAVEIYNNSSRMVTAYACVDFTGEKDSYIKISDKEDDEYLGFDQGVLIGYDYTSWGLGTFNNTKVNTDGTLILTSKGSSDILTPSWLCPLPINSSYYRTTPFGSFKGWEYDYVNEIIWAAFYTGTNDTNGLIKLYKYTIATNIWLFTCDIYHVDINMWDFSFTCDDTYLYFYFSAGDQMNIYRHDPSGSLGNLTLYGNFGEGNYGGRRKYMTTDYMGNVYLLAPYDNTNASIRLYRYNGGISAVKLAETDWWTDTDEYSFHHSTYDGNLYFIRSNHTTKFMQKYNVSTNTWSSRYFDYGTRISSTSTWLKMCPIGNYFYFYEPSYGTKIYRYDLSTNIVEEKDIGVAFEINTLPYMVITAPLQPGDDFSAFITSVFASDRYYLYGYNTGYEQMSTLANIVMAEGTYTTPIIYLDDPYKSSYIKVKSDTKVGSTSVSKDAALYNGTIEMRTSKEPYTPIDEIYWGIIDSSSTAAVYKYTMGTASWQRFTYEATGTSIRESRDTAVCRRSGKVANFWYYHYTTAEYYLNISNREGADIFNRASQYSSTVGACFDGSTALWWYDDYHSRISRIPSYYIDTNYTMQSAPYAIAAELNGTDCWFTDRVTYTLNRLSPGGSLDLRLNLSNPYGVCSTEDLCVWVAQPNELIYGNCVQKYDRWGNLLQTIKTPKGIYRLTHDHHGGFYGRSSGDIGDFYHYDEHGNLLLTIAGYPDYDYLKGGQRGFVTYNWGARRATYFCGYTGKVLWTKSQQELGFSLGYGLRCPDIFPWDEESQQKFYSVSMKLLPVTYDPIWYGEGMAPWVEVPKDGYFLSNNIRHQFRITLRNFDGMSTPVVRNITMAPAVKIKDIPPQESRPMYIRSDVPVGDDFVQFDVKIKVWWSAEED